LVTSRASGSSSTPTTRKPARRRTPGAAKAGPLSTACRVAICTGRETTNVAPVPGPSLPAAIVPPARGWVRVEPGSGAITATRLEVGLARTDVHARIDVRYFRDPKLQLWLPAEMRDHYSAPSGERVDGNARYRNFKRFEVEASWRVRQ